MGSFIPISSHKHLICGMLIIFTMTYILIFFGFLWAPFFYLGSINSKKYLFIMYNCICNFLVFLNNTCVLNFFLPFCGKGQHGGKRLDEIRYWKITKHLFIGVTNFEKARNFWNFYLREYLSCEDHFRKKTWTLHDFLFTVIQKVRDKWWPRWKTNN